VVVGQTDQAFRWTAAGGPVGLGDLPGGAFASSAADVSADGSVVVGVASVPGDAGGFANMAFRWTAAGGMVALGDLAGGLTVSFANAVSDDGSVVVGVGSNASGFLNNEAFRWTAAGGMVGLGFPPGAQRSRAFDVSADGLTVVGRSVGGPNNSEQAFRWTTTGGMVALGFLPGDNTSRGSAVSADGSVVVGTSYGADNVLEAFRWTAATGMVGLGSIPGGSPFRSQGLAVSADGSIVLGGSNGPNGPDEAFIWDATNGMRSLTNVLVNDFGLNLTGWSLSFATGISDDGLVLTGWGGNAQGCSGWVADLRPPPLCTSADMNNDGVVDGRDIASFVSVLINQNGTPQQVCAGDVQPMPNGSVGLEDVPSFVACVLAGGC